MGLMRKPRFLGIKPVRWMLDSVLPGFFLLGHTTLIEGPLRIMYSQAS